MARKTTRGAQGAGTIRQRKDGRWEGRYTAGRDTGTGKQIQCSVYGATQQEVRKKLASVIASIDDGTYKQPCKMTLGQWLEIWTTDYLGGVKQSTAFQYGEQIKLYIRPALGAIKLDALSTHQIQGFYNKLSWPKDGKAGLSPNSIKQIHGILHGALQQAVAIGYIRFNPSNACTLPRVERREIKPLSTEQIRAFLAAIDGHRHEVLFKTALFTGMREGELLGLAWENVDFAKGVIHVKQQLMHEPTKGGKYYLSTPKSGKPRTITPAPWVMNMLRAHRTSQIEQRFKLAGAWEDTGMVFTNLTGGYLAHGTVYESFKRVARKLGIPDARFHDLRHTYAVISLQAGDDIKTVQSNLGHHTAAFTLDIYGHVTDEMKSTSAGRMEAYIEAVSSL